MFDSSHCCDNSAAALESKEYGQTTDCKLTTNVHITSCRMGVEIKTGSLNIENSSGDTQDELFVLS